VHFVRACHNQRTALHRFVEDGRLAIDNGVSERELGNLALGRHNWGSFANETGLQWYTVFRSLIASSALHDVNAQECIEMVLRFAPHWPVTRMLERAPKYWAKTVDGLDAEKREEPRPRGRESGTDPGHGHSSMEERVLLWAPREKGGPHG
jgi:hypothetical protein